MTRFWRVCIVTVALAVCACTLQSDEPRPSETPLLPTWEVRGATLTACAPRTDWQAYVVASNDNLTSIARRFGTTVQDLVQANCLANPNRLSRGQTLYVPPPRTPTP